MGAGLFAFPLPGRSDPLSATLMVPDFVAALSKGVAGLRVAVSATCGYAESDPARLGPLDEAARALDDAGARVERADPPIWNIRRAYVTVCEAAFAGVVASMPAVRRGMMVSAAVERQAELERVRLMQ